MIIVTTSRLGKRGERVVTNVGRDAMDAGCVARRAARTRTTKSCGPGAPGLAPSLAGDLRDDGDYEVTDTGESTNISVNTIAQGRPDVSVEPVVNNSCASFTAHEAAGAASARSSLRPCLRGTLLFAKPWIVAGMRCHVLRCHAPRKRGIQYSRAVSHEYGRLWDTGSPGQAGRRRRNGCLKFESNWAHGSNRYAHSKCPS
jgi:hypothetical protein